MGMYLLKKYERQFYCSHPNPYSGKAVKKKVKGDGFENFHYDYKNIGGGSNDISFTVNMNLGDFE
jgi:hypothetical protein